MAVARCVAFVPLCLLLYVSYSEAFVAPSSKIHCKPVEFRQAQPSFVLAIPNPQLKTTAQAGGAALTSMIDFPTIRRKVLTAITSLASLVLCEFRELSKVQKALLGGIICLGFRAGRRKPFWKRFTNVLDISPPYFGSSAPILKGRTVSVSDGDTIRFLHVPTWFHPKGLREKEKASEVALPIRVCTIDTPETPKCGKPGEPFGKEAMQNLAKLLANKPVKVRMLRKDQYGRAVGEVFVGRWPCRTHIDEQMLKDGLAEVCQGDGAVYGPLGLDAYLEMEQEAKSKQLGIWS